MGKINQLDFQVANMIAAGEVVDRPASVVKELLENSIDAGATEVTVEIKRGGITFIRVTDNGCGMTREDVALSVKRHATSKIKDATDLDGIMTLGFRGEALAAISSVSKLRIMTRSTEEEEGSILTSDCGTVTDITGAGCREGTTVIVEELFANVPARRKFLKKDASEGLAVGAVVEKLALSRPDVSITFITDNQRKFATEGDGSLYNAMYAVLGRDFAKKTAEVNGVTDGIEVTGYIGRPDNTRANRNCQNFFINGRYVKSRTAAAALEAAFDSYIPSDRFPVCVLNIVLHPAYVDVNVHPAKLEVKFSNEKPVFDAIYSAVRNSLTEKLERPRIADDAGRLTGGDVRVLNPFVPIYDRYATDDNGKTDVNSQRKLDFEPEPTLEVEAPLPETPPPAPLPENAPAKEISTPVAPESKHKQTPLAPDFDDPFGFGNITPPMLDIGLAALPDIEEKAQEISLPAQRTEEAPADAPAVKPAQVYEHFSPAERRRDENIKPPEYRMLGEAFNSYIVIEVDDRMLMIDKHAAHERIIFEQLKRNMREGAVYSQILMLPLELDVTPEELAALIDYKNEIEACGFSYVCHENEHPNLTLMQIPGELDHDRAETLLVTIAGRLADGTGTVENSREMFYEKALYQASCKAAIKAGRIYAEENNKWICDRLLSLADIKYCPHGRPVAFEMTKNDIAHKFGRT